MDLNFDYFFSQTSVVKSFKDHINSHSNTRILFSGNFGAGKSTFLNHFFEDHDSEYVILKLFPINYSVASNEDVFELIKYDLFAELLSKHADKLNFSDNDFSPLLLAQSYISNDLKIYPFIKALLKASVPKAETALSVVESAKGIYDNFKIYEKKIKSNEKDIIKDYIDWCENRKGSIYEYDEITILITELISRVKLALDSKPVVLIVDDLDRLDPEHVFRLFNIFSAHYDIQTNLNKFRLDKVIFVCDYSNIQNMYIHKYGAGVDFEGYINKFYSTHVFEFDNRKHLNEELLMFFDSKIQEIPEGLHPRYPKFDRNNTIYNGLVSIFTILIDNRQLTIRNLDRFKKFDLPQRRIFIEDKEFPSHYFFFLTFIHLLLKVIDKTRLNTIFKSLEEKNITFNNSMSFRGEYPQYNFLILQSLFFVIPTKEIMYAQEANSEITIGKRSYSIDLKYDFETNLYIPSFNADVNYDFNVFTILALAYRNCVSKGYV
jgi:hypothetical protein